jgi:hypothetical protein
MDAFKESHSPGGLIILVAAVPVNEGSNPANQLPLIIVEQPAGSFAMFEIDILFWIEDGINLLIEGTNPGFIVPV